jgi:hypothetical protein
MVGKARQDAKNIAINNRCRLTKDDAGNGASGVSADTGQRSECCNVVRDLGAVHVPNGLRRTVQKSCASVVAKTLPCRQYLLLRRVREGTKGGEPGHETGKSLHHPGHLRLLEHQFADQCSISRAL